MHIGYYQGILQLRNVDEDLINYVFDQFEKENLKIAKIKRLKTGIDIYSPSNKFSRKIAKKLLKMYGGETSASPTLFSRDSQTSKNIYRLNVLYKSPEFKKGDIVEYKGKVCNIISQEKNNIVAKNVLTGKKEHFMTNHLVRLEKVDSVIINLKPKVQILDPETNQAVEVENKSNSKEGDVVSVVIFENKFYIV
jgi:NMD protein affecting ribosome stability and mRNA decay